MTPTSDPAAPFPEAEEHRPWVTNLVLLVLVGALGLWVYLGEGHTRTDTALRGEEHKVFPFFDPADALTIELGLGDERLTLAAQPGADGQATWRVTQPVEDRADDAAVRKLLGKLQWLEVRARVEGTSEAGFGAVTGRATIERRGRPPVAFEAGEARGGVIPLRRTDPDGAGQVVHVDADLGALLTAGAEGYRSKALFTVAAKQADQVAVRPGAGGAPVVLTRTEGLWRAGADGAGDFGDGAAVDAALAVLEAARAVAIAGEAGAGEAVAAAGLGPEAAAITLRVDGATETLRLGAPVAARPGARHARIDGRPVLYEVLAAPFEPLLARGPHGWLAPELFPAPGGAAAVTGFGALFDGGPEVRLQAADGGAWVFQGEGRVQAAADPVKGVIDALLALRIAERLEAPSDPAALGLDAPSLRLELVQASFRQEVAVGAPVPERPGVYAVQRLLPPPAPAGSVAVYTCELGALPEALEAAPLELLDRRLFQASSWDAREVTLAESDGAAAFHAKQASPDPNDPKAPPAWRVDGEEGSSAEALRALLETFDAVHVDRYVARTDGPDRAAVLARYGLDAPRLLTIGVETWKDGAMALEPRVLRLGRRTGDRVFATTDAVPAVGSIHAGFLDRIARGFAPGTLLLDLGSKWDVRGLEVERAGRVVFTARRPELHWKRGARIIEEPTALEDVIEAFERVEVRGAEPATPARLAETGLDAPAERITFTTRRPGSGGADVVTEHVLLLGKAASARERWATTPGGEVLGRLFDEALTGEGGLNAYLEAHPDPDAGAPFPPAPEGGD